MDSELATHEEEVAHDKGWADFENQNGGASDQEAYAYAMGWRAARKFFSEDRGEKSNAIATSAPVDDGYIRQIALHAANQPGLAASTVVSSAEEYLKFLKGAPAKESEGGDE